MKNILFVLPFILLRTCYLFAGYSSINTGVMPFCDLDNGNKKTDKLTAELTDGLSKYEFINLIDRSQLGKAVEEIKFGMSGLVDEKTAPKAGAIQGLQLMITGSIRKDKITAQAIQLETQKIIASASVGGKADTDILAGKLASGIETYLAKENLKTMRNDTAAINLDFWAEVGGTKDKPAAVTKIGENLIFHFKSSEAGYITLIDIQPGGDIVILYPNDMSPANKISADKEYSIPSKDDNFQITVSEPAGADTIVAFFTKKSVDWLDRSKLEGQGFKTVKNNKKLDMTRGIKVVSSRLKDSEWKSKVLEIQVNK